MRSNKNQNELKMIDNQAWLLKKIVTNGCNI